MNNYEKIKQMTVEEMADFLADEVSEGGLGYFSAYEHFKQWLLQEAEE